MYGLHLFLFENNVISAGNNNRRPASRVRPAQMMPAAHESFRRISTYSSPSERRATFWWFSVLRSYGEICWSNI